MKSNDSLELSIIIPAYNAAYSLKEVLPILLAQSKEWPSQIIIVDDGSYDETVIVVEKLANENKTPLITLIKQKNQGRSVARNVGIENARGKIILFMDSDIIPSRDLIRKHMEFHNKAREIQTAFQGRVIQYSKDNSVNWRMSNTARNSSGWVDDWTKIIFQNLSLKREFISHQDSWFRIGPLFFSLEDIDIAWRFNSRGLRVYYSLEAEVYHNHPRTLKEFIERGESEAKSLKFWLKAEPCVAEMLTYPPLCNKFKFINPVSPIHYRMKRFMINCIVNSYTEELFITLCILISNRCFPIAYRISSQMFIRRFVKTYSEL